jgi:O-antigen/teichoic acid export membrane protein
MSPGAGSGSDAGLELEVELDEARPQPQPSLLTRARPLMLARSASAVLTFAIPLVLARMLTPESYGTYKQFVLVAQTLYLVLPFGMAQSLYYFVPRAADRRPVLTHTLGSMLFVSTLAAICLVTFAPTVSGWVGNPGLIELRWPWALYAAGLTASYPLEIGLTAKGRTGSAAIAYLLSDAVRTAAMTLPVLFGRELTGLAWGLAGWAIARTLATLAITFAGEGRPTFDRKQFREQLGYALPFGLAMAIAVPQQYFHQYAVSASVTAATFALYSVGCFQLPVIDLLYTPTSEVLMVRISELDSQGELASASEVFREASGKLCLLFVPLSAYLISTASDFIATLFSERYIGAVSIFRVAAVVVPFASLPVDGVLRACDQTRAIFISYLLKALLNIPLVLLGLHVSGALGAIVAWAVCEVFGKALLLSRVPSALHSRLGALIPWKELAQAAAASMVAAVGVTLLQSALVHGSHLVRLLTETAVFGIAYALTLLASGAKPQQLVLSLLRRQAT